MKKHIKTLMIASTLIALAPLTVHADAKIQLD